MTTSEGVKLNLMRKGLTQDDIAKKLKLTPTTISRRMASDNWKVGEIAYMKHVLNFDL